MDETQSDCHWMHSIRLTLGSLTHREINSFISSIPSVSAKLREPNDEPYSPKLVAIGPIHRGTKTHLLAMEEHKWHYMHALLHRAPKTVPTINKCGKVILGLDDAVRASYGGYIKYEPHELAKIMLLDGCFLLELLLRLSPSQLTSQLTAPFTNDETNHHNRFESDPLVENKEILSSVLTDLTLLENQIPFFVLKTLARIIFSASESDHHHHHIVVSDLALSVFGYDSIHCSSVAHFLHLLHLSSIVDDGRQTVKQAHQELSCCATRLRATGVTIRPAESTIAESTIVTTFDFNIRFSEGVLKIPPLRIEKTTEIYLRNFIAWEQSRTAINRQFTSYALFFKGLLCSLQDIELLVANGVIVNELKISNEDLLAFFGTITNGVDQMDSSYTQLCEDLNTYSTVNALRKFPIMVWHYCRLCVECVKYFCKCSYRILIRDHIPNVWKLIGVVAAALLLALTIMQTYYSAHGDSKF